MAERRRLDVELSAAKVELDEAMRDRSEANDRASRLQTELNRVIDELRQSEERQRAQDAVRQRMDVELRELAARLEMAETAALRDGKKLVNKLQTRVR